MVIHTLDMPMATVRGTRLGIREVEKEDFVKEWRQGFPPTSRPFKILLRGVFQS